LVAEAVDIMEPMPQWADQAEQVVVATVAQQTLLDKAAQHMVEAEVAVLTKWAPHQALFQEDQDSKEPYCC
jgi:hypothetical protein